MKISGTLLFSDFRELSLFVADLFSGGSCLVNLTPIVFHFQKIIKLGLNGSFHGSKEKDDRRIRLEL